MTIQKNSSLIPIICSIWVTLCTDVSIMVNGTDRFHKLIRLKNSGSWRQIYFTPSTAEFIEKPKQDDPGIGYEQSLKFNFPGEDSGNNLEFDEIQDRPLIVLIRYSDEKLKLFGSTDNGARLIRNSQTSNKLSGSEIIITCNATEPSWWAPAD